MWIKRFTLAPLILLSAGLASAPEQSADLAIVVNESSLLENVSSAELSKIFKAERTRTPGGFKYIIGVRDPGSSERKAALKDIYHMTDPDYEKFFLQATFAGKVQTVPKELTSPAAVRQFIASSPGAISYLRANDTDASVKILKVDGKAPGDPAYPISIN
jgi:hypothetical protein